jgi:hypothetical protein
MIRVKQMKCVASFSVPRDARGVGGGGQHNREEGSGDNRRRLFFYREVPVLLLATNKCTILIKILNLTVAFVVMTLSLYKL